MTSVAEVLSPGLQSAAVLMLNFNIPDRHMVPVWAVEVPDRKAESKSNDTVEKPKYEGPSGYKVAEGKLVGIGDIFAEAESHGFVFVRMVFITRSKGFRMSVVMVRKDLIKPHEVIISADQKKDFIDRVSYWLWDARVFRNPGENGGNFISELGNPLSPKKKEAQSVFHIDQDGEFDFQPVLSRQERAGKMSKELADLAGQLKQNASRTR